MKVGELKKWPKVYDLYKSYCEDGYSDDEEIGEHFSWDGTEEGYAFWELLSQNLANYAKKLQPHLFEVKEEEIPEEDLQEDQESEWIEWKGGPKAPVSEDTEVEVRYKNGDTYTDIANIFTWWHDGNPDDIIAYKIIDKEGEQEEVEAVLDVLKNDLKKMYETSTLGTEVYPPFEGTIQTFNDKRLDEFKLNVRKQLNVLVADGVVDGDVVESFDKLLREM